MPTSAFAQRANNTADGTTGDDDSKMDTLSMITTISWVATTGLCIASLAAYSIRNSLVAAYEANPFVIDFDIKGSAIHNDKLFAKIKNGADGALYDNKEKMWKTTSASAPRRNDYFDTM